jgi:hypothetical protein
MKTLTASIILALLSNTVLSQYMPWEFKHGSRTDSGRSTERCRAEIVLVRDPFSFQSWAAQSPPRSQPQQPQPGCNVHHINSKEWEHRDQQCVKTNDKKAQQSCYDRLDKDKKNDKTKADNCVKEREKYCQNIQDNRTRDDCRKRLDADRKGQPPPPPSPQPQQVRPETRCCLRLYDDRNCKQRVYESCSPINGYAQGDVQSWNVICS